MGKEKQKGMDVDLSLRIDNDDEGQDQQEKPKKEDDKSTNEIVIVVEEEGSKQDHEQNLQLLAYHHQESTLTQIQLQNKQQQFCSSDQEIINTSAKIQDRDHQEEVFIQ